MDPPWEGLSRGYFEDVMADRWFRVLRQVIYRWRAMALVLLALLLTGCVQYDLTLRFDHQNHGQIIQTIDLSQRSAALASPTLSPWLADLSDRTQHLGGQLRHSPEQVTLAVPFSTPADLVNRYTQLLADSIPDPAGESRPTLTLPGFGTVPFAIAVQQTSWLLASRTRLTYDLDLTTLPTNTPPDGPADPWANLTVHLQVPWGIQTLLPESLPAETTPQGATWTLQPGQVNHIAVTFWLPNAVALGSLAIGVLVLLGYFLRYGRWSIRQPDQPKTFGQN
jgi:hypothetical protein